MKKLRENDFSEIITHYRNIPEMHMNPFVSAQGIVKDFDLGDYLIRAIDHLDLEIAEHEYVAIIGASGAGKTSLLHILGGLDKPTDGKVYLSHVDITPMEEETLATFRIFSVGLVFQNYNLISSLTAQENIMFPMQLCGISHEECEKRASELLKQIGLEERAEHLPFQLSAGEQQRIAIARALANDPPVIIADEPTANLDKKNAEFIGTLFEQFRKEGKTIILATHDEKLFKHAHRILEMDDGKIISDKRIHEIDFVDNDKLERSSIEDSDEQSIQNEE
ncbi:ABC transporter ATP-binding protein [Candidatus Lokiarchaeum ossiferum]|uniref:ABC transporter ATP-binding protein n=1 Tax=Candidatus Lokiarchaeum ossiferum TaxID=2951803 RepID=UPI00352F0061